PKVDPQKALTLTVEPLAQPVSLHRNPSLKVWLENRCDQSLVICRRLDGSGHLPWPTYEVHLFDATGKELKHDSYRYECKTRHPLRKVDFFRLQPGEKVDVFSFLELANSSATYATEYRTLRRDVPYTLAVTYRMDQGVGHLRMPDDEIQGGAAPLLREALR